jgi:hypothetical protein
MLLAVILLAGCGSRHNVRQPSPEATAESARRKLQAAMQAHDEAAVRALVATDATIRLPDGREWAGADSVVIALLNLADSVSGREFAFQPDGRHLCTAAIEEQGIFTASPAPVGSGTTRLARFMIVWGLGDPGTPVIRKARFHSPSDRSRLPQPCRPLQDSLFGERRLWIALHGVTNASARLGTRFERAMASAGWSPTESSDPSMTPKPAVFAQLAVSPTLAVGAHVATMDGSVIGENSWLAQVGLEYDGVLFAALGGLRRGSFSTLAGLSYLYLHGDWRTTFELDGEPRPLTTEPWNSWAIGPIGEIAFMRPLSSRLGFEIRLLYVHFQTLAIPGYRGSEPLRIGARHWSLSAGAGIKPW